jgi:hypothetical protein
MILDIFRETGIPFAPLEPLGLMPGGLANVGQCESFVLPLTLFRETLLRLVTGLLG